MLVTRNSNRRIRLLQSPSVAVVALAALAAQILVPHFHAGPAPSRSALGVVGAGVAEGATTVAATAPDGHRDADRHSPASCPLCRAQSDARSSLLPTVAALPFISAGPLFVRAAATAPPRPVVVGLASPRAPPVAS